MKRTLMMLFAALAMATVASVQADDVKINLQNRGPNQQMTSAQNVKYSISNAEGEIVAEGEKAEIILDLPEGNYEITVEQTTPNGQVRYGAQQISVPAEGANLSFEITPNGLRPANAPNVAPVRPTIPRQRIAPRPNPYTTNMPQLPPQASVSVGRNYNTWGVLGLAGALVATAIALGVDDDDVRQPVSGVQR